MTVQIVVAFHLTAAVRITIFAKARAVTLENVNPIAQKTGKERWLQIC